MEKIKNSLKNKTNCQNYEILPTFCFFVFQFLFLSSVRTSYSHSESNAFLLFHQMLFKNSALNAFAISFRINFDFQNF